MLGKGLESLIPKKDGENIENQAPEQLPEANNASVVEPSSENLAHRLANPENSPTNIPNPVEKFEEERKHGEAVFQIEVERIEPNPHQPRRNFDEDSLRELASSIREFGILQPVIVSKIEKENDTGTTVQYELIAGERRLLAAKLAGLHTVPAIVRKPPAEREKLELAIIENLQRADLNPIEMARAFARLQDEFRLTQREIGARLGKSREVVANAVRLLNLPSEIQQAVSDGRVGESQARLLLAVEDIVSQRNLFEEILRSNLSVREIKSKVRNIKSPENPEANVNGTVDPEMEALKERLEEFLGTKVDVNKSGDGGKLTINFYSEEELRTITEKLLKNPPTQNDTRSL